MTPDVPSTTDTGPGRSTPTPSAPAPWSPAPAATGTPSGVVPVTTGDSSARGSQLASTSSADSTWSLQLRAPTSNQSVPDASVTSVARSPDSPSRTLSLGINVLVMRK